MELPADTIKILKTGSFIIMCIALAVGAFIIMSAIIKGIVQERQAKAALAHRA
jgi:hypothetical protein